MRAPEPDQLTPPLRRVEYTCHMHGEIRSPDPGTCPLCGTALEPQTIHAEEEEEEPELRDLTRRFWISAALTLPLLTLGMGATLPSSPLDALGGARAWTRFALATPVVTWGGWPFLLRAVDSVRNRSLDRYTLIGLGVGVAWLYSVVATLAPGLFPPSFRGPHGEVWVHYEAASVTVTLALLGRVLELRVRSRLDAALRSLLGLAPHNARKLTPDGQDREVPLELVQRGDWLRVRPGETIPADGEVVEGRSAVDESMVSGEPVPAAKGPGDAVIGGTRNATGSLVMETRKVGSDTLLPRIVAAVTRAQLSRAPLQRLADRVASWFVPIVLLVAVLTFAAWSFWGPEPRLAYALANAVAVLLIACPCALGLAAPMSILVATGRGAGAGVLFRDAEALELLRQVDTLVLDKTGTLTQGRPTLATVRPAPGFSEEDLLRLAAVVERASGHPLAAALVGAASERSLPPTAVEGFESLRGRGVLGRAEGRAVAVGTRTLMQEVGAAPDPETVGAAEELRGQGQTVMFVAVDGRAAGLVSVFDPIQVTAPEALRALREEGLRLVMLTGDDRRTAEVVAARLGIEEVIAEVPPDAKADVVRRLQSEGRVVAMAGDGVEDAPALAQAEVGIALDKGTAVAMGTAEVTLMQGDLRTLVRARRLSRATMANIRQNLFFACAYNALGVPVAAGALYPFFGVLLSPMLAAPGTSLGSMFVIANALRLRGHRL